MNDFEWTQPIGGRTITWAPLNVGQELDVIAANNRDERKHLIVPTLLMARIRVIDGQPAQGTMNIRDWDSDDYTAFQEEVDLREAQRRAAFKKAKQGGSSPLADLEIAIDHAQVATQSLSSALRNVLEAARAGEAKSVSPLPSITSQ